MEKLKQQEEELAADGTEPNYEKLAELRYDIARLEEKTKELAPAALGAEVEEQDLAHVIELWTGIPASRIQENELKKVETRIEELETRDKEIDDTLVLPDVCTNVGRCAELSREKDKIQQELEELYEKWETLA